MLREMLYDVIFIELVDFTVHVCLFTAQEFGLFLSDEDPKKGVWLESARTLEYYLLRNGVCYEFRLHFSIIAFRRFTFYINP